MMCQDLPTTESKQDQKSNDIGHRQKDDQKHSLQFLNFQNPCIHESGKMLNQTAATYLILLIKVPNPIQFTTYIMR